MQCASNVPVMGDVCVMRYAGRFLPVDLGGFLCRLLFSRGYLGAGLMMVFFCL